MCYLVCVCVFDVHLCGVCYLVCVLFGVCVSVCVCICPHNSQEETLNDRYKISLISPICFLLQDCRRHAGIRKNTKAIHTQLQEIKCRWAVHIVSLDHNRWAHTVMFGTHRAVQRVGWKT